MSVAKMEAKLLISGSPRKIYLWFLGRWASGTLGKWNCLISWIVAEMTRWVSWTSGKLHGPLFLIETIYLLLKKTLPLPPKKYPFLCIKHFDCDMEWRIKRKVFKKMVDEFRTKSIPYRLFVENCFHKKNSQVFIYLVFIFI